MGERVYQPYVPIVECHPADARVLSYYASRAAYNHAHAEGVTW